MKISHADRQVVDDFIKQLDDEFGKESPLTKSRGDIHDYLGMILDFSASGVVRIDMSGYLQTILSEIPKDMNGTIATPATAHLFKVNTDNPLLFEGSQSRSVSPDHDATYVSGAPRTA
jgi:hypothetical protein